MYRNYFYREDLKVELTQLEEEDEKERFLEGSKHKRLIPGYVALEVKENTCKISPVLYPEFRGKGYWKDARELLLERIFKERFFTEENGRRVPYRIDRVEIVLYQKPRDIARSTEGKLLFRDLKPYLQIFGYFSVVDRDNWSGEMYKYRDDINAGRNPPIRKHRIPTMDKSFFDTESISFPTISVTGITTKHGMEIRF